VFTVGENHQTLQKGINMAYVAASVDILADPDSVWALIGPFGAISEWLPGFGKAELDDGGRVRRLFADDGSIFVERMVSFDDAGRSCTYTIVESPLGVADHRATLTVQSLGEGSSARVDWTAAFSPTVADQDVAAIMQGFFDNGLAALARKF
jgi:hypothetical protein